MQGRYTLLRLDRRSEHSSENLLWIGVEQGIAAGIAETECGGKAVARLPSLGWR